ncbi:MULTISPECIES: CobW family GTP-binding protein [Nitrosomonas]|uniref:ATP-binding protein n=1 Tax=Nitrosomonas communis TaxID=44574 RepID=A0A0F7KDW3_9PROT|nr:MULTISPECIES: GTP-binding protein [Nitrosomonas]AKH37701.1 ATP-binding protein [Nitrosomonas communis]TYP87317.1 G3E family GTPase [Nitrosomonas communis]UVS63007.1 GTP-binding protein [Nitrosomonas sp. PLL12]
MTLTSPTPSLIPVTLLTGYLGSGKTTILNHIMQQAAMADTLVIINEFGEIALDHLMVVHSTDNVVMEMGSGCLCCTIRSDLVKTLQDLTWRFARNGKRQFHRTLIETTGLADPAPIIHTLMADPKITNHYRLDGIVATIDMATGNHTLSTYQEAIKQAAIADCLLLTKTDLATSQHKAGLLQRLNVINPAATRWQVVHGQIEAEKLLDLRLFSTQEKTPDVEHWLREEAYLADATHKPGHDAQGHTEDHHSHESHNDHLHDINRHDDHIRAYCFTTEQPVSKHIYPILLDLLFYMGSNILRIKGIVNIEGNDGPMALHGVQHILHPLIPLPAWTSEDRRSKIVFITRDVERETVEKIFKSITPVANRN